jgi:cell wall-associated NlpC family hydrolase
MILTQVLVPQGNRNYFNFCLFTILLLVLQSCSSARKGTTVIATGEIKSTVVIKKYVAPVRIDVKNTNANELVDFAETLKGVPYKYGSMVKEKGFDCSGFVNYVFNHFKINVPRTTVQFTNAGKEVSIKDSKRGDIILFTGSDAKSGVVGHMGFVTRNTRQNFEFIHAASGNDAGVIVSGMNSYFIPRFVKVIRVFPDEMKKAK